MSSRLLRTRSTGALALSAAALLVLSACAGDNGAANSGPSAATSAAASSTEAAGTAAASSDTTAAAEDATTNHGVAAGTTVTDMAGDEVTLPETVDAVIATDNRAFRTLDEWGVQLAAAPVDLMFQGEGQVSYVTNEDIVNIGNHREPDMEVFVTAEPDVVFNGQRFAQHKDQIAQLAPDAAVIDTQFDPEQTRLDEGLKDLTTLLGAATGHADDAAALNRDFDAAIARAKDAYSPEDTVMGLIVTGGDISYVAPGNGRAIGPVFDILELTPAVDQTGSNDHQGDDISVEAIAAANPDWLIVMDRDAATGESEGSAAEVIENSEALKDVTAVQEDRIVYLPVDFYVAEDIQNYTTLFNRLADAFASAR
ncbi:MAG: ABC transporter substrate-binding protein [Micrococcus sp.]|nr:ABC transporter substrate-binding protein [Micrococcus sp.]